MSGEPVEDRPESPVVPSPARVGWTLAVCVIAAAGELVLLRRAAAALAGFPAVPMMAAFTAGPMAFLAVLAWRRRTHPGRTAFLLTVSILTATTGLGGFVYVCFGPRPNLQNPGMNPLFVPLAQWLLVLAVWLRLEMAERREKRAARS